VLRRLAIKKMMDSEMLQVDCAVAAQTVKLIENKHSIQYSQYSRDGGSIVHEFFGAVAEQEDLPKPRTYSLR
jgi:hypothetical protein